MGRFPPLPGAERTENLALRSPNENNIRTTQLKQSRNTIRATWGSIPMSGSTVTPVRRVRHEVRDSIAVMIFSATASCAVAVLLTLLVRLGN